MILKSDYTYKSGTKYGGETETKKEEKVEEKAPSQPKKLEKPGTGSLKPVPVTKPTTTQPSGGLDLLGEDVGPKTTTNTTTQQQTTNKADPCKILIPMLNS